MVRSDNNNQIVPGRPYRFLITGTTLKSSGSQRLVVDDSGVARNLAGGAVGQFWHKSFSEQ